MMKGWGTYFVSSALEVFHVLRARPTKALERDLWRELLAIEPPVWGGGNAHKHARSLTIQGLRVWSFDDFGVVFSPLSAMPPFGIAYRAWGAANFKFKKGQIP